MEMTAKAEPAEEQVHGRSTETDGTAALTNVEGAIRDFVRRDLTAARRLNGADSGAHSAPAPLVSPPASPTPPSPAPSPLPSLDTEGIERFLQRTGGASIKEIDHLIAELHAVRDFLQAEGERVQREVANYTQTTKAALASARIILDSMGQWKSAAGASRNGNGR